MVRQLEDDDSVNALLIKYQLVAARQFEDYLKAAVANGKVALGLLDKEKRN